MTTSNKLLDVLTVIRQSLECAIAAAKQSTGAEGTCALATVLLRSALPKFTGMPVEVRGGAGERGEGLLCLDGEWRGHFWLEVLTPDGPYVVDITADQFGFPPIVCIPLAQAVRYRAGDQAEVEEQISWTKDWLKQAMTDS